MMRDSNNVRGALQKAASLGRGGDTQMAHVGKGEVLIPPEVIDTNPQVMAPLIKAFQKSGMDWRRYLVGGNNSTNPSTGQKEFFGEAEHGGITDRASDAAGRDPSRGADRTTGPGRMEYAPSPTFEQALDIVDPGGANRAGAAKGTKYGGLLGAVAGGILGGIPGAYGGYKLGQKAGGFIGGQPAGPAREGDLANPEGADRGTVQTELGTPAAPAAMPEVPMPAYLEFAPGMTPLQMRSQIATYGLNSDDTRYQTQEAQDYYKYLLHSDLQNAGDLSAITPIEQQYLKEVLGYDFSTYEELMAQLNPAAQRTFRNRMGGI